MEAFGTQARDLFAYIYLHILSKMIQKLCICLQLQWHNNQPCKKIATNVWWMKHEAKKYLIMAIWGLSMFFKSLGCTCTYDDHYEMNGRLMQVSGCFIYCRRFFSKFTWHDLRKFHQMYLYFYQFLTEQFNIFLYTFNPNKLLIIFK